MANARLTVGVLCALGAAWWTLTAQATEPQQVAQAQAAQAAAGAYAEGGTKTCLGCHDQAPVNLIFQTPMAVTGDSRTPFAQQGCETCHGPSAAHVASPTTVLPAIVFRGAKKSPVEARNGVCLSCHESGLRMNWKGSLMESSGVACVNCHTAHAAKDPVLVKATQPQVCFTCHAEQRAQSFEYSHHPIREGKVVCSDCHNPHGSPGPKALKEYTINETCYTCHAEKRGPLLWEHPPVAEDCTNCHTPHGSTQARLLKERPPYLCQNCHDTTFHPGEPYSGANTVGGTFAGAIIGKFQLMAHGCINCHSQIHGSNNPAGAAFLR